MHWLVYTCTTNHALVSIYLHVQLIMHWLVYIHVQLIMHWLVYTCTTNHALVSIYMYN